MPIANANDIAESIRAYADRKRALGVHVDEWLKAVERHDTNWRDHMEEMVILKLKELDKIGLSDPCHVERGSHEHWLCCVFVTQDTDPKNTKCINVYRDGRIEEYFP